VVGGGNKKHVVHLGLFSYAWEYFSLVHTTITCMPNILTSLFKALLPYFPTFFVERKGRFNISINSNITFLNSLGALCGLGIGRAHTKIKCNVN
jgi:hypothetical protein